MKETFWGIFLGTSFVAMFAVMILSLNFAANCRRDYWEMDVDLRQAKIKIIDLERMLHKSAKDHLETYKALADKINEFTERDSKDR